MHLPPDILQCIFKVLESATLGRFWLTGDKRLMTKLKKTVKSIELEAQPRSYTHPNLVAEFTSLDKFIMKTGFYSYLVPETGFNPAIIPPNTKHIELHLYPHTEVFFGHLAENLASFSNLVTLISSTPSFIDLALGPSLARLSQLETLQASFNVLNLEHLPASLTSLDASFQTLLSHSKRFGSKLLTLSWRTSSEEALSGLLPDGLESLTLDHRYLWSLDDIEALPKSLTSLESIYLQEWTQLHLAALPPQLTRLTCVSTPFKAEMFPHLPRTLTECTPLDGSVDGSNVAHLPHRLGNLLDHHSRGFSIDIDAIPLFSKFVTHLRLDDIPDLDTIDSLPSNLKALQVRFLSVRLSKLLPRALESLIITDGPTHIEALEYLPSTLTELKAIDICSSSNLSTRTIETLPASLKHFSHQPQGRSVHEWPLISESVNLSHLETLHLNHTTFAPLAFGNFKSLVSAYISTDSMPLGTTKLLPETLTNLDVVFSSPYLGLAHDMLTSLPKFLIYYTYGLRHLPNPGPAEITNASVTALPFTLVHCRLQIADLTEACIPALPKSLRLLTIGAYTPKWFSQSSRGFP